MSSNVKIGNRSFPYPTGQLESRSEDNYSLTIFWPDGKDVFNWDAGEKTLTASWRDGTTDTIEKEAAALAARQLKMIPSELSFYYADDEDDKW